MMSMVSMDFSGDVLLELCRRKGQAYRLADRATLFASMPGQSGIVCSSAEISSLVFDLPRKS